MSAFIGFRSHVSWMALSSHEFLLSGKDEHGLFALEKKKGGGRDDEDREKVIRI
jgi:hypothetical protein